MKKRYLLLALLTILNILIYFFRDSFQFVKYSTYTELYAACDAACRDKWDDFLLPYSEASLAEARRIAKPLHLDTGTTFSKINAISQHLYLKFHKQSGYPQEIIHRSAPVEQYKILSADTAQKLWCGTYAQMVSFFCWAHGIISRNVEINKPGDHHVLNECYLPETGTWMMVDVTNNIASAEQGNKQMNAQDFVAAFEKKTAFTVRPAGTLQQKPFTDVGLKEYYSSAYPFYYYHAPHLSLVYRTQEKIKRYFLPAYWMEIYTTQPRGNFLFYAKLFFIGLWLILAGTIVFKRFIK